jgi:precorrin-6Y C5,15-methyltransferase (decarboxylating)
MKDNPNALWDSCLQLIKNNVSEQQYNTWFKPIAFESYNEDKNTVLVRIPSPYIYEYLEENYVDLLSKVLSRTFGKGVFLNYRVLTDKEHNPAAIAARMLEFGYSDYKMAVGEHLGHPDKERVREMGLKEARIMTFSQPNCLILTGRHERRMSIPDHEFMLLDGRERMITKNIIRTASLHALELWRRHDLWDVGFCTGSVSIEARLQFPHLHVEAFEIRPECEDIIRENARRFGAPGISIHTGDFLTTPLPTGEGLPDAVFIGGHGGKLKDIMARVLTFLSPDGVIVMNSVIAPKVTTDSRQLWDEACQELGLQQEPPLRIQLNDNHPITILKCRR